MRNRKVRRPVTPSSVTKSPRKVQTTLRLPRQLYERAKQFVDRGNKRRMNELMVDTFTACIRAMERRTIGDAFWTIAAGMQYQPAAVRFTAQFLASQAETI